MSIRDLAAELLFIQDGSVEDALALADEAPAAIRTELREWVIKLGEVVE